MKRTIATLTACLLGAACANRPDSIHASYVSHEKYAGLDCPTLALRMFGTRHQLAMQSQVQNAKADGDAVGVFFLGIPFSKLSGDVEGEIARLKGEILAIETATIKSKCGPDASQMASSASGPAVAGVSSPPKATPMDVAPGANATPRDAGLVAASGPMPAVGTTWVYRFEDRVFSRNRSEFQVRVENRDVSSVSEVITTGEGASRRIVLVENPEVLRIPLGGNAPVLEFAPYLLARSDEGASLTTRPISGYPHGRTGLPAWNIRVTHLGWKPVSVAAGSFHALGIQIDGARQRQDAFFGQDGQFRILVWYAPEVKRLVKLEHQTWETYSGMPNGHSVLELAAFRPPS